MKTAIAILFAAGIASALPAFADEKADAAAGEGLFKARCAFCHEGGNPGAPTKDVLKTKEPAFVVDALLTGKMMAMASGMSESDAKNIAFYITGKAPAGGGSGR